MQVTQREQGKILTYLGACLARRRRARGLKLKLPESMALITEAMLEAARDGRSATEVMALGNQVLTRDDVMLEGPRVVTRGPGRGDLPGRHQAGFLPRPDSLVPSANKRRGAVDPIGGYQHPEEWIEINPGR